MILRDQNPQIEKVMLHDPKRNMTYRVQIRCRRMGEDNGKDQLVHIGNYFKKIRDHIRVTARNPTKQELERMAMLLQDL